VIITHGPVHEHETYIVYGVADLISYTTN